MRLLPLPTNPESLRLILDDLNRFIEHYGKVDLETDLALGYLPTTKDVLIGAASGHPEAKRQLELAMQGLLDSRPWIMPRINALLKLIESPGPTPTLFPGYLDFPDHWGRDAIEKNDDVKLVEWEIGLIRDAKPGEYSGVPTT